MDLDLGLGVVLFACSSFIICVLLYLLLCFGIRFLSLGRYKHRTRLRRIRFLNILQHLPTPIAPSLHTNLLSLNSLHLQNFLDNFLNLATQLSLTRLNSWNRTRIRISQFILNLCSSFLDLILLGFWLGIVWGVTG